MSCSGNPDNGTVRPPAIVFAFDFVTRHLDIYDGPARTTWAFSDNLCCFSLVRPSVPFSFPSVASLLSSRFIFLSRLSRLQRRTQTEKFSRACTEGSFG